VAASAPPARTGPAPGSFGRAIAAAGAAAALFGVVTLSPIPIPAPDAAFAAGERSLQRFAPAGGDGPAVYAESLGLETLTPPKPVALYTLQQFMSSGVVNWGGYRFTYYSQQVLPGSGLAIPGRHVNEGGYVSDGDGFIVLAGSAPKGTVYETPFGYPGKIYDRGTSGNHLDVYVR
jgi:hypothetical protein